MMKKLLCLAAALVMLCGTALGEAFQGQVTFSADAVQLAELLEQISPESKGSMLAQGLAKLLEKLSLGFFLQEDAGQGGFYLSGEPLSELTVVRADQGEMRMLFSFLPDHYFAFQTDSAAAGQHADMKMVAAELFAAAKTWWDSLPGRKETGSFMGDAYAGGSLCVTRSFDDAQVAGAVESLLDTLQRVFTENEHLEAYLPANEMWQSIRENSQSIADANRYSYTVKEIYSNDGTLGGLSLTVMDGDAQVSTASLGLTDGAWKLVLGWGLNEKNYYLCIEFLYDQNNKAWTVLMYQDPQRLGFRTVEALNDHLLWLTGGAAAGNEDGTGWRLDMQVIDLQAKALDDFTIAAEATVTDKYQVNAGLYLPDDEGVPGEQPVLGMAFTLSAAPQHTWAVDDMQRVEVDASGQLSEEMKEIITEAAQQGAAELAVKLFKALPAELLTFFMQSE